MNNCQKLNQLIHDDGVSFIMEAHNGMSARIAEETGFKAIWASGLSMSASEGVRDNNELSFTEVAKRCEVICEAVNLPVLLDFDSGYGTFNTAVIALKHMIHAGISGIVIEDKKFPKLRNSLHDHSEEDELADITEHSNKIKALREEANKHDRYFTIVARLESFLAGKGCEDALIRAESYLRAGADAILVHSKKPDSCEIDEFCSKFRVKHKSVPILIVPTKYYKTPTQHLVDVIAPGAIIWANHQMRACVKAMQEVTQTIFKEQSLVNVEGKIATVKEIFRLQRNDELEAREKIYMPKVGEETCAIVLAATRGGKSLNLLTKNYPKCMIPIGKGKSTADTIVSELKSRGISNIVVVSKYKYDYVKDFFEGQCNVVKTTGTTELMSLFDGYIKGELSKFKKFIVIYGDCIYESSVYGKVVDSLRYLNDTADIVAFYTNRENDDRLNNNMYYAGVIEMTKESLEDFLFRYDRKVETICSNLVKICSDEGHILRYVSVPKDSWCDINDIKDIGQGVTLL